MRGPQARAADVAHRPPGRRPASPADYSRLGPPAGWRVLRRRMSLAQPLSPRLARLGERLAGAPPVPMTATPRCIWAAVAVVLVPVARRRAAHPPRRARRRSVVRPHGAPRRPPGARATPTSSPPPSARPSRRSGSRSPAPICSAASTTSCPEPRSSRPSPSARSSSLLPEPPGAPAQSRGGRRRAGSAWTTCCTPRPTTPPGWKSAASRREFPAYRVEEAIVWGMTERILTEPARAG